MPSSSLSTPGGTESLPIKSLAKLESEVWANSLIFNLGEKDLILKKECAGICVTWGNRDFISWWVFAHLSIKHWQYRSMFITLCPSWERRAKVGIAFPISRAVYFLLLGASLGLASCQGRHWQVCHLRCSIVGQSTPQDCAYANTAHQPSWWSASVEQFEIYLFHFFFLHRTEKVNRHLSRTFPGVSLSSSLVRHFQWRTLDSGTLFQRSPEQIHWPVGHSQAFTWRRNGWAGFFWTYVQKKREKLLCSGDLVNFVHPFCVRCVLYVKWILNDL